MKNRVCPCQLTLRIPVHTAHGDFSGGDGGFCPVWVGNEKGRLFVDAVGVGVGHVVAPDELDVLSDGDAVGGKFPQPGVFFGEQGLLQFAKRPDEGGGEAGAVGLLAGKGLQTDMALTSGGRSTRAQLMPMPTTA